MRIRKTLAKALGQPKPYAPSLSELWVPPPSSNSIDGLLDLSCPLNQSPWDVFPNQQYFRSSFKCGLEYVQSLPNSEEEPEDTFDEISKYDEDVIQKKPTMKTIEEKQLLSKRVDDQSKSQKKEDKVGMENNEIKMCKKNDGRNWFCKQPAKLPHNYCENHFWKSRSYKYSSRSGAGGTTKNQKRIKNLKSEYHYYDKEAPAIRKRRRGRNADDGINVVIVEDVKMDKINVSDGDDDNEVEVLDHKAMPGSDREENLKTDAKKTRKLVKYRPLDSFNGRVSKLRC